MRRGFRVDQRGVGASWTARPKGDRGAIFPLIMQVFQDFCDDHFTCPIVMNRMMSVGNGAGVIKQNGGLKMNADGCSPVAAVSPSSSFETGPANETHLVLVRSPSIEIGDGGGGGGTHAALTRGEGISSELLMPQAQPATECPAPSTQDDASAADGGRAEFGDGGTAGVICEEGDSGSSTDDSPANSSSVDEPVPDEEQTAPLFSKQALEVLLDELTGEFVALEDFDGEIDVEFYRRHWFGSHSAISLATFQVEHHQKGKCTAHVDGAGKLISDPDVFLLARKDGVPIALCVHRGLTEDQKIEFMLRPQARYRFRTEAEERKLRNATIEVQLRLGFDYETIAEMVRVSVNTVRNVENRAATNPNSKLGITKRPDGRFNPETLAKIAEAAELRKAGMGNAEIAAIFGTDVESVGRWFKDPTAQGKTKNKDKPGKRRKTSLSTPEVQPKEPIKDTAASHRMPELHRRVIEHFVRDFTAYDEWRNSAADKARQASEAVSTNVDELLKLSLYGVQLAAAANADLEQLLSTSGEVNVEEASPAESGPNTGDSRPDLDHRSNLYMEVGGLKAGATEKEVV